MNNIKLTTEPPDILLIIGTDASGKNHVANFVNDMYEKSGYGIEKRDGWFSAEASDVVSSEDKGFFSLLKEKIFLSSVPLVWFPEGR